MFLRTCWICGLGFAHKNEGRESFSRVKPCPSARDRAPACPALIRGSEPKVGDGPELIDGHIASSELGSVDSLARAVENQVSFLSFFPNFTE